MWSAAAPISTASSPAGLKTAAAGTSAPAIEAEGVCKSFDDRAVLDSITLRIGTGEHVALLGANGAGKSTLLKILATLTRPTAGRLCLFGTEAQANSAAVRRRIGLIGHQSMLYGDLTARENLEFFGKLYGLKQVRQRAEELLKRVGLAHRADDPVKQFSRGMVQRAAIGRALMHDPELLLADEPFAGLDVPSARGLEQMLRELCAEGKTIVLVNHDIQQSLDLAARVVVLRGGRIALDRATREVNAAAVLEAACP